MNELSRVAVIVLVLLLAIIMPFVFFAESIESWFDTLSRSESFGKSEWAWAAFALLSFDIVLPVPSSVINTAAGAALGLPLSTAVCWMGMNLSVAFGYAIGSCFGCPVVNRLTSPEHVQRTHEMLVTAGPVSLVLLRGLPVVAEASILMAGIYRLPPSRFAVPVLGSNLGIAFGYSLLGVYSSQQGWLPIALGLSLAIPLLIYVYWRMRQQSLSGRPDPPA